MIKKSLIVLSLFICAFCETNPSRPQPAPTGNAQYDFFDYWFGFGWLYDYSEEYDFENQNVTSKF
jgi:hypothetical protein